MGGRGKSERGRMEGGRGDRERWREDGEWKEKSLGLESSLGISNHSRDRRRSILFFFSFAFRISREKVISKESQDAVELLLVRFTLEFLPRTKDGFCLVRLLCVLFFRQTKPSSAIRFAQKTIAGPNEAFR